MQVLLIQSGDLDTEFLLLAVYTPSGDFKSINQGVTEVHTLSLIQGIYQKCCIHCAGITHILYTVPPFTGSESTIDWQPLTDNLFPCYLKTK